VKDEDLDVAVALRGDHLVSNQIESLRIAIEPIRDGRNG
jgi:hypothetical protein